MAKKIVPESQAVDYANKSYAYTDESKGIDYYQVDDDAATSSTPGNSGIAGQLANAFNLITGKAAPSSPAVQKKSSVPIVAIALIIALAIAGIWAYKKYVK